MMNPEADEIVSLPQQLPLSARWNPGVLTTAPKGTIPFSLALSRSPPLQQADVDLGSDWVSLCCKVSSPAGKTRKTTQANLVFGLY